jgi:hypothetical protein
MQPVIHERVGNFFSGFTTVSYEGKFIKCSQVEALPLRQPICYQLINLMFK